MSDEKQNLPPEEPQEPIVYASPVKRAWAWVGIVYMLIFMATFTYYLTTTKILIGIGPLLLCPALGGLCATAVFRYREGRARGGLPACVLLTGVCTALLVLNLLMGVPALMRNLGG